MTEAELEAAGWRRLATKNFSQAIGSTWSRGETGARTIAWLTDHRCDNDHGGMVHGGAQMTFADIALGCAVADAAQSHLIVTAQLQFQFVAAAPIGALITCVPEVVRKTSQLVFVRGLFKADGKVVGSADGIWKVLDPAKLDRLKAG